MTAAAPPCSWIQNENFAATPKALGANNTAMTATIANAIPRIRAFLSARRAARPSPVSIAVTAAAVMDPSSRRCLTSRSA